MELERTAIILHDAIPMDKVLSIARNADEKGFWGIFMIEEAGYNTQVTLGAIATVTRRARLGSSISSIFTRSAPIYAMSANTLNALSQGRALLGLGTSPPYFVKHWHSMEFTRPVSRLKDYIRIVRGILESQEKMQYEGHAVVCRDFVLAVDPPANKIPLYAGVIGPQMIAAAGEVADGVHVHPVHSLAYIRNRLLPEVAAGAAKAGRSANAVDLIIPVFAVPGDTPEERAALLRRAKTQIGFYGSTPNYAFQFDDLGFEGTSARLNEKLKAGDVDGMADTITEELLDHFAVVAAWDDLADALVERYRGTAARLVMYLAEEGIERDPRSVGRWGEIARAVRAA